MSIYEVQGGKKLSGEIVPQGAKNEALQVISAVLLTADEVTISNVPDITDVNMLITLLKEMNVKVVKKDSQLIHSRHKYQKNGHQPMLVEEILLLYPRGLPQKQ